MFRTQEDLELVLLQFLMEFNEGRSESPGVIVYKGYKEAKTGVLLETFPFTGMQLTPADASSFFLLGWEDLKGLAKRLNVSVMNETSLSRP
jgi:hypothetical protein